MDIHLTSGKGQAPTALAAFDQALLDAEIGNFNLIYLSSIIPPGSHLITQEPLPQFGNWGDRLYVVLAQQRETEIGTEAWAGVGWAQEARTGKGLFVEHYGNSAHFVEAQIEASLRNMVAHRIGDWGEIEYLTTGITCEREPVCAVAAAVFHAEAWASGGTP